MNTTDTQTGDDFDLDTLADAWMGEPVETDEPASTEEPDQGGEGEEAKNSSEASNEVPTTRAIITPEQEEEIFNRRLNEQLERARRVKAEKDLQTLIETGSDEDIAKWTREQIEANRIQAERDSIATEARTQAALDTINNLLDEEFVSTLTPEEAQSLLPENFKGSDRDYIRTITELRATKARTGLYTEEDVQRLVEERIQAQRNVQRGNQFRSPSPSQAPTALPNEDRHAGLEGNDLKDSLWQEVIEGWQDDQ